MPAAEPRGEEEERERDQEDDGVEGELEQGCFEDGERLSVGTTEHRTHDVGHDSVGEEQPEEDEAGSEGARAVEVGPLERSLDAEAKAEDEQGADDEPDGTAELEEELRPGPGQGPPLEGRGQIELSGGEAEEREEEAGGGKEELRPVASGDTTEAEGAGEEHLAPEPEAGLPGVKAFEDVAGEGVGLAAGAGDREEPLGEAGRFSRFAIHPVSPSSEGMPLQRVVRAARVSRTAWRPAGVRRK